MIDLIVGDPRWFPHPVRFIGFLCNRFEGLLRWKTSPLALRISGAATVVGVMLTVQTIVVVMLCICKVLSVYLFYFFSVFMLYLAIALGDLLKHSRDVYTSLRNNAIDDARKNVARLVGRDTQTLNGHEISRACIESVAENQVDGVTAPLFYMVLAAIAGHALLVDPVVCAVAGGYFYKTVNTLDSMIGYQNERYRYFGTCAARLDDVLNYVPARIGGLSIVIAALLTGMDFRKALSVFYKDRLKSSSPNSGHTEAATAGALSVQLGGSSSYFGKVVCKPLIGGELALPEAKDILGANRLVLVSSMVMICLLLLVYLVMEGIIQ